MNPPNQPDRLHALPILFAAGPQSGSDLAHARETGLPVCMRVQTRSLSSLPRTLFRLISYSVAGYNLVMVNSVTVLGTTELSSRPTKEEWKSQLTLSRINTAHGTVYIGAPGCTWSGSTDGASLSTQWERRFVDWECWSLETLHAGSTPSFYRLPRAEEKELFIRWFSSMLVFVKAVQRDWLQRVGSADLEHNPLPSQEVSVTSANATCTSKNWQDTSKVWGQLPLTHSLARVAEIGPLSLSFPPSPHLVLLDLVPQGSSLNLHSLRSAQDPGSWQIFHGSLRFTALSSNREQLLCR